jgi:hypothetical protein
MVRSLPFLKTRGHATNVEQRPHENLLLLLTCTCHGVINGGRRKFGFCRSSDQINLVSIASSRDEK